MLIFFIKSMGCYRVKKVHNLLLLLLLFLFQSQEKLHKQQNHNFLLLYTLSNKSMWLWWGGRECYCVFIYFFYCVYTDFSWLALSGVKGFKALSCSLVSFVEVIHKNITFLFWQFLSSIKFFLNSQEVMEFNNFPLFISFGEGIGNKTLLNEVFK